MVGQVAPLFAIAALLVIAGIVILTKPEAAYSVIRSQFRSVFGPRSRWAEHLTVPLTRFAGFVLLIGGTCLVMLAFAAVGRAA